MVKFKSSRADKTLIDTNILCILVLLRAVLDTLGAKVKSVVFDAGLAGVDSLFTLEAWLFTSLADTINSDLVGGSTGLFASLVKVEHVARKTFCTFVSSSRAF